MKKLYELDASQEFGDESNATESSNISEGGIIAGDFEAVSGMGIGDALEDDESTENNLQDMLAAINERSSQDAEDFAKQEAERQAYLEEEERRVEEAKARFNKERYEKEQAALAERNERERLEKEEEERLAAEKAENSFFGKLQRKLGDKIPGKKSKKAKEDESFLEAEQATKSDEVEVPVFDEPGEEVEYPSKTDEFLSAEEDIDLSGFVALEDKEEEPVLSESDKNKEFEEDAASFEENEKASGKKGILSMLEEKIKARPDKPKKTKSRTEDAGEPDWKFIATHDEVTGLLNARAYKEDLKSQKNTLGVIFFNMNGLRSVNEAYGRMAGDRVIENIAGILKEVYGKEHLYRIGGDEFVCIVPSPGRNFTDTCIKNSGKVHNATAKATKEDPEKALHSVSIGYAMGDGEATVEEVVKVADYAMFQNKKAYKLAHERDESQKKDAGKPSGKGQSGQDKKKEQDHDELLSKEQKELKDRIKEGHSQVSRNFTANVLREIQKRAMEIEAIFIASPTFDHLFVVTDIDDFLDMMEQNQALIDYSYLYVVYQGGTQYYGADEYYDKVTDLFRNVAEALLSGKFRSEKDVQSIPGINIFKNVYV